MPTTRKQTEPSDTLSLVRVPPWEVPLYWDFVSVELSRALAHNGGQCSLEDTWRSLVTGAHSLWVVIDGSFDVRCAFTTFIHDYERKRVLFTSLLAGRGFREFSALEPQLAAFAKDNGCDSISSFVIPRVAEIVRAALPKYKITHYVMERELHE